MHDINKDIELAKYRYSLAEETYRSAKMCFDNGFTETASIELIMRCFMEYVVYLHWKVQILNVIKMWWPILIKNLSQLEDFQEKWDGAWRD